MTDSLRNVVVAVATSSWMPPPMAPSLVGTTSIRSTLPFATATKDGAGVAPIVVLTMAVVMVVSVKPMAMPMMMVLGAVMTGWMAMTMGAAAVMMVGTLTGTVVGTAGRMPMTVISWAVSLVCAMAGATVLGRLVGMAGMMVDVTSSSSPRGRWLTSLARGTPRGDGPRSDEPQRRRETIATK